MAKDVCDALGVQQPVRAVENLDSDEVSKTHVTDSLNRKQETYIISESGLYALVLRSNKPNAREFRKWVTGEVLPSACHSLKILKIFLYGYNVKRTRKLPPCGGGICCISGFSDSNKNLKDSSFCRLTLRYSPVILVTSWLHSAPSQAV